MSAARLPENLDEWPTDPYAVLGVQFGIDPRDLRRVYTQLIRSYKPEQFPEHFRRIREAYEAVLRHVPFFGLAAAASSADIEASPAEEAPALERRGPDLLEQMQTQWELACRGQESEAYSGLRALYEQHPTCDELCMRLYWLLTLAPEVDSLRKPCDWLVAGLRANNLTGPLRELYRRELADTPGVAGTEAGAELFVHVAGTPVMFDLAGWRWLAAARLEKWDWIIADIAAVRERVCHASPEQWVLLLMAALHHLAWGLTAAARKHTGLYYEEVQRYEHLHLRLSNEYDRLEHLHHLSTRWHALSEVGELPGIVADLIAVSWEKPEVHVRPRLDAFLAAVARQPRLWLETLTRLHRQGRVLTDFVRRTLEEQQSSTYENASLERAAEDARCAIADFLDLQERLTYDEFRKALLTFCLAEAISPQAVARSIAGHKEYLINADEHLSEIIAADVPLLCTWLAHQLFWA